MGDTALTFDVRRILESLKTGLPISGEAGSQLLSPSYKRAIAPIIKSVYDAQHDGPIGKREVFWVSGKPGNGKTQTLRQLIHEIRTRQGITKFAYVFVDLGQKPEARKSGSLIPIIVRSTLSSSVVDDVERICAKITETTPTTDETLSFGIEVISELAQIPALALFLRLSIPRLLQFFRSREVFIKNTLRQKWGNYPELLEFLTAWVQYTLKPSLERSEVFDTLLKDLALRGVLFPIYEFTITKARYSSLVLILDEVENVTVDSLKPIWDWQPDSNTTSLNIIFVLSAQDRVIDDIKAEEILHRRFLRTLNGHIKLPGPEIKERGEDDVEHIVLTLDKLLLAYPEYRGNEIDPEEIIKELRSELSRPSTWQDLWQAAIGKMTDL